MARQWVPRDGNVLCVAIGMIGMLAVEAVFGQHTSEIIASEVSSKLSSVAPREAVIARTGPSEFLVMMPSTGCDHGRVNRLLASIRDSVASPIGEITLGYAAGVAYGDGRARRLVLERARSGMEIAARRGAGAIEWCEDSTVARRSAKNDDEAGRSTTGDDAIRVQPIVAISTGAVIGYEALARSTATQRLLETDDVTNPLDASALADELCLTATLDLLEQARGTEPRCEVRVSMKVSPTSLAAPSFADAFLDRLGRAHVEPTWVQLELTDRFDQSHAHALRLTMARLQQFGVRLALDDFGTGAADLCTLSEVDFDVVKLSPRLLAADLDGHNDTVLRSVVRLAGRAGVTLIAKGVETPEQHERLLRVGCAFAQGPLYGHPEPYRAGGFGRLVNTPRWDGLLTTNRRVGTVTTIVERHFLESPPVTRLLGQLREATGAAIVMVAVNEPVPNHRVFTPNTADGAYTVRLAQWARSMCEVYQAEPELFRLAASGPADPHGEVFGMHVVDAGVALGALIVVSPTSAGAALSAQLAQTRSRLALVLQQLMRNALIPRSQLKEAS